MKDYDAFRCIECFEIFSTNKQQPMVLVKCGHNMCCWCLGKKSSFNAIRCPICEVETNKMDVVKNFFLISNMDDYRKLFQEDLNEILLKECFSINMLCKLHDENIKLVSLSDFSTFCEKCKIQGSFIIGIKELLKQRLIKLHEMKNQIENLCFFNKKRIVDMKEKIYEDMVKKFDQCRVAIEERVKDNSEQDSESLLQIIGFIDAYFSELTYKHKRMIIEITLMKNELLKELKIVNTEEEHIKWIMNNNYTVFLKESAEIHFNPKINLLIKINSFKQLFAQSVLSLDNNMLLCFYEEIKLKIMDFVIRIELQDSDIDLSTIIDKEIQSILIDSHVIKFSSDNPFIK